MGQPAKADEQRASSPTEDRNRARRLERVPEQSEIGVGPTETRELHRMHALLQAWRTERRASPLTAAAIDLADACLGFRFGADPPPPGKNPVGAGMNFKNGCVYRSGKTLAHDAGIVAVILPTDDKDTRVRKEEVARRLFNSRKRELVEFGFLSEPVRVYPFDPSLGLEERHKCRKCRLWGGKGTSCRHPWKRGASRFTVMPTTLAALLELERAYIAAGNAPRVIRERTGTREVDARTLRARWERNKQRRATHPVAVAAKAKRAAKVAWTDAPLPSPPPAAHDVIREGQITSLSPEQTPVDRALEPELEITSSSELGSRSQITSSSVSTGTVARRAEVLPADLPPRVAPAWTDDSPSAHRGFAPCSSRPAPAPTSEPDAPRPTEPTRAEARSTPAPDTRGFATKNPAPDPRSNERTRAQAGPTSPLRAEAAMVLERHERASGVTSADRELDLDAIIGALSRGNAAIRLVLAAQGQAQSDWNRRSPNALHRTAYWLFSRDDRIRSCIAVAQAARARAAAERAQGAERAERRELRTLEGAATSAALAMAGVDPSGMFAMETAERPPAAGDLAPIPIVPIEVYGAQSVAEKRETLLARSNTLLEQLRRAWGTPDEPKVRAEFNLVQAELCTLNGRGKS
jgi:hypothetical protein